MAMEVVDDSGGARIFRQSLRRTEDPDPVQYLLSKNLLVFFSLRGR